MTILEIEIEINDTMFYIEGELHEHEYFSIDTMEFENIYKRTKATKKQIEKIESKYQDVLVSESFETIEIYNQALEDDVYF